MKIKKIVIRSIIVLILIYLILSSITPYCSLGHRDINTYRMRMIYTALGIYAINNDQYPDELFFAQAIKSTFKYPIAKEAIVDHEKKVFKIQVPLFDDKGNYLDAWGTPFRVKVLPNKWKVIVKSFGPNKKDDNGLGDDIIRVNQFDEDRRKKKIEYNKILNDENIGIFYKL